ncbi:unnamed protein product, partial [Heterobilharzia americana]
MFAVTNLFNSRGSERMTARNRDEDLRHPVLENRPRHTETMFLHCLANMARVGSCSSRLNTNKLGSVVGHEK